MNANAGSCALTLTALLVLTGCSIDSHDSRLDHCLEGHDEPNGGNPYFVCDKYDLPYREAK